ncbi:serine hydrolase domain-containing protein [Agromyces bauzanensis]|uniref:Beta-lactamase-related domain-containing protein n=1 Tax=Agromyces bauzanensis TaxID=1308924 RepID=A0A917PL38_9MICO|nr:serine hydrolase [Agromyces bauzanensis]GGJ83381.1 hypothetical protein GCM10011372_22150 [Agromyces bauzanensis]
MTIRPSRSTPAAAGIPEAAIGDFVSELDRIGGVHSVVVVRAGAVVAEAAWHPYRVDEPHTLFSVSKSVTSLAVGLAIDEGLFALDDRIVDLLPEDVPEHPQPRLRDLRVEHLLTMTSGHAADTVEPFGRTLGRSETNWVRAILALPIDLEPGTRFVYNSGATYLLSAIVQRHARQRLTDYLESRLFRPLGIERPTWEQCPRGVDVGGWGLSLRPLDMAVIGQLLLQRGEWQGRQLVPSAWVDAATSRHVDCRNDDLGEDWAMGYGYQFWRTRHGAYRADGAWGQYILVWPQEDMVVALTAGEPHMELEITAIWTTLLGRLDAAPDEPLAGEPFGRPDLVVPLPRGAAGHVPRRHYTAMPNAARIESMTLAPGEGGVAITFVRAGEVHRIRAAHGRWSPGRSAVGGVEEPVAASYAIGADGAVDVHVLFTRTAFRWVITLAAGGGRIEHTVAFGALLVAELERVVV